MRRLLKNQEYKQMPWKNGKGSTQEVIKVDNLYSEDFLWRLSIADIKEDGEFSIFSGYQRIITVLEGKGMQLSIDGRLARPLLIADPFAFSGDAKVNCSLLDGYLRDFNLIYDPSFIKARLQWFTIGQDLRFFSDAQQIVIFNAGDKLTVQIDDEAMLVNHYDTLWNTSENGLQEIVLTAKQLTCCVIELNGKNIDG